MKKHVKKTVKKVEKEENTPAKLENGQAPGVVRSYLRKNLDMVD